MKILTPLLVGFAILAFSFAPSLARAQDDAPPPPPPGDQGAPPPDQSIQSDQGDQGDPGVSFQQFYDQLGDQGSWVQTDDYGYVFQPNVTDPNWAPYTDGHWVYSDQGWVWVSDEPWGWATYHYGRWANIDGTGWVWVPGYRWAPAWVSWRYGGGYCGWAPLPPETFVGAEYGGGGGWATFHFGGDVDVSFGIGAGCYNFVRVGDFGRPNYRGAYIDRSRNFTVINNTTNITNININRNGGGANNFRGVAVGGPPINEINAHSRERVPTVRLAESNQAGRSTLQGNTLNVYAPRVNAATVHQARPTQVGQTLSHPTFNRGNAITQPLQVTRNVQATRPSETAIQAAQTAQLHAPAKAKIATERTVPRTTLSQPLTSLPPVAETRRNATTTAPGAANTFNNAQTPNPGAQHPAASAPFTGESVNHPASNPSVQTHPQNEQAFHPQTQNGGQVQHPNSEVNPSAVQNQSQEQAQQEARQQQQAQVQQEARQQQQAQAQQEAHQQQQAQVQQQFHQQQQPVHQEQVQPQQQQPVHQQQAPPPAQFHPAAAPQGGGNKPAEKQGGNSFGNPKKPGQ
jgi:hypothetical protein